MMTSAGMSQYARIKPPMPAMLASEIWFGQELSQDRQTTGSECCSYSDSREGGRDSSQQQPAAHPQARVIVIAAQRRQKEP